MEGPTNQAVWIINRESLAPIEAAYGKLIFVFSSVTIKVYKSNSNDGANPPDTPKELASEI